MKSCDGIKIETARELPTDQLNDKICCSSFNTHRLRLGELSLTRHIFSLIDTSSIAVTHYNIQRTSILHKQSLITASTLQNTFGRFDTQLPTINNKVSMLSNTFGKVKSLLNPLQCSMVEPLCLGELTLNQHR